MEFVWREVALSNSWIGLDIGGANIKWTYSDGPSGSLSFPLWQRADELAEELRRLLRDRTGGQLAITMTGELADCFESKQEGVCSIVESVEQAADGFTTRYFQLGGRFVDAQQAVDDWQKTAAANWYAIAQYSAGWLPNGSGFVMDLGSTTLDIIPVRDGQPANGCPDDTERLRDGQLVYLGAGRTPVCSLIDRVQLGSASIPLMREFFATTKDLFLYRQQLPDEAQDHHTADGRSATRVNAIRRLAKCFGADSEFDHRWIDALVNQATARFDELVKGGFYQVVNAFDDLPRQLVLAGEGAWYLADWVGDQSQIETVVHWREQVSEADSCSAAAFAVAALAASSS